MADLTDAELDRLVERNNRYIASLRGENELKCGNGMASFALEESTTAITTLRARIAEDQAQIAALTTYRENLRDEVIELRARIAELEAERAEWVEVERLRMGKTTPPTPPA